MAADHRALPDTVRNIGAVVVAATLVVLLIGGSAAAANRWTDISDEQWENVYGVGAAQVATAASGFPDGTFQPARIVTQAQLSSIIATALRLDRASVAQMVSEHAGDTASSSLPVTRQAAYTVLGSLLSEKELEVTGHIAGVSGRYDSLDGWYAAEGADLLTVFADRVSLGPDGAPRTAYLVLKEVVRGSSRGGSLYLDPAAKVTRGQAVALVLRAAAIEPGRARVIDPLVSTVWLAAHVVDEDVVVVDLRSAADYAAGHIPGAISVPFSADSAWATSDELTLEMPADADLFKLIGDCGITEDSSVVLVGGVARDTTLPLIDTARVAATLVHAGIYNVAILQGGFWRWVEEARTVSRDVPSLQPLTYGGPAGGKVFVGTEYVESRLGEAMVIDTRPSDVYFGVTLDVAGKPGHLPTARSLPAQWLWQAGGTYVSAEYAQKLAGEVVGINKDREIIVYCAVGGTASSWWYVLSQVLGYRDVKLYDGSVQAWAKEHELLAYSWFK